MEEISDIKEIKENILEYSTYDFVEKLDLVV